MMKRLIFCVIAVVTGVWQLMGQNNAQIASIQYWLDNNHTAATVSSALEFDIDCSALPPGLHTLHYRVADSQGRYTALQEHGFFKIAPPAAATKVESLQYWWDDMSANAVTAPYGAEEFLLPTSALPYGLHSLKYRVRDDAGRWSDLKSHYFYKGEPRDSARIVSYTWWWNDLKESQTLRTLETPAKTFELDEDFTVPEEARTGFAGHYTATLNIVLRDNLGHAVYITSDVKYPDNDAPVTDIDADRYVTSSTVTLTWTESTDDMMGDYNVYYSRDGGPFLLWLPDTTQTSATFEGQKGSTYVFTVTGRDAFGNREKYDESKCVSVTFE